MISRPVSDSELYDVDTDPLTGPYSAETSTPTESDELYSSLSFVVASFPSELTTSYLSVPSIELPVALRDQNPLNLT